jgi:hypothetical protein
MYKSEEELRSKLLLLFPWPRALEAMQLYEVVGNGDWHEQEGVVYNVSSVIVQVEAGTAS